MSTCVRGLPANCGGGAQVSSGRRSAIVSIVAMGAAGIAGPWCVVICQRPYAAVATNRAYFSVFGKRRRVGRFGTLARLEGFPLGPSFRLIAPWPQRPRRVKHSFDFRWEPAPQTDIVPPPPLFLPGIGVARGGLKEMGLVLASAFRYRRRPDRIRKRDRRWRTGLASCR